MLAQDRITGLSNADRELGRGIRKDAVRCQSEELWSVKVTGVPLTFQRTPLCHIGPDMSCHYHVRCAGYSRKKYGGVIDIIRDEIVRQRKMLVHCPEDGGQCVLCPGAVRPFTVAVRFGNGNGNHLVLNHPVAIARRTNRSR